MITLGSTNSTDSSSFKQSEAEANVDTLPVMAFPGWNVLELVRRVYGAGELWGTTPVWRGSMSSQAPVGAPLGYPPTDPSTCMMRKAGSSSSITSESVRNNDKCPELSRGMVLSEIRLLSHNH